ARAATLSSKRRFAASIPTNYPRSSRSQSCMVSPIISGGLRKRPRLPSAKTTPRNSMLRTILRTILRTFALLLLFLCGQAAAAPDDLLEPDQAFRFSARAVGPDTIEVQYQ